MSKMQKIIAIFILSVILMALGAIAKINHWESIKPLLLVGLALQTGVILYALTLMVKKNKQ